jgi:hypothetical protein
MWFGGMVEGARLMRFERFEMAFLLEMRVEVFCG